MTRMQMSRKLARREANFWNKVDKSGECWIWTGAKIKDGYGQFWDCEREAMVLATHFMWFLMTGSWPTKYMLHTCDRPSCVRFEHLREGDQADNMEEAGAKGHLPGLKGWK